MTLISFRANKNRKTSQLRSCVSESRGGRPGLPVPNSPDGLCRRKATLNLLSVRGQELRESRGGRPGLPVPKMVLMASVDIKQH